MKQFRLLLPLGVFPLIAIVLLTAQPVPSQAAQVQTETQVFFETGFEEPFSRTQPIPGPENYDARDPDHLTPPGMRVFYADEIYTDKQSSYFRCTPVPQGQRVAAEAYRNLVNGCVDDNGFAVDGRPEFVIACQPGQCANDDPRRIRSGDFAAQYFWFLRTGEGGYFTTINVPAGTQQCTVTAHFQGTYFSTPTTQNTDTYFTILPYLQASTGAPFRDGDTLAYKQHYLVPPTFDFVQPVPDVLNINTEAYPVFSEVIDASGRVVERNNWYDEYQELTLSWTPVAGTNYLIFGARSAFPTNNNMYWDDITVTCNVPTGDNDIASTEFMTPVATLDPTTIDPNEIINPSTEAETIALCGDIGTYTLPEGLFALWNYDPTIPFNELIARSVLIRSVPDTGTVRGEVGPLDELRVLRETQTASGTWNCVFGLGRSGETLYGWAAQVFNGERLLLLVP